ncbi:putative small nuclear ribonucleoprotein G [Glycine max]|nr:putative small nuclear ribonucleoprotein G [Glycine max]
MLTRPCRGGSGSWGRLEGRLHGGVVVANLWDDVGYACVWQRKEDWNRVRVLTFCYVKLNANRMVVGTLRGFDQFMNLVVDNTVEVNGNEKNDIGMVVIRGNSVVTVEALEPVNRT